ncbi:30S ribosomal protein S20 [Candidatus Saccharibacteria bacterium]|nr:30S ribosomal protein S20 [Candidatus Saccharibacteria bacterium]
MPIIKSATKKMKQDQRRYARNLRTKRVMRTAVKTFEAKPSFDTLREAQSKIDTAVKKNLLSQAAAARRMSHLSAIAKQAGVKIVTVKKTVTSTTAKTAAKPVAKTTAKPVAKKTPPKKPAAKATTKKPTIKK